MPPIRASAYAYAELATPRRSPCRFARSRCRCAPETDELTCGEGRLLVVTSTVATPAGTAAVAGRAQRGEVDVLEDAYFPLAGYYRCVGRMLTCRSRRRRRRARAAVSRVSRLVDCHTRVRRRRRQEFALRGVALRTGSPRPGGGIISTVRARGRRGRPRDAVLNTRLDSARRQTTFESKSATARGHGARFHCAPSKPRCGVPTWLGARGAAGFDYSDAYLDFAWPRCFRPRRDRGGASLPRRGAFAPGDRPDAISPPAPRPVSRCACTGTVHGAGCDSARDQLGSRS